MDHFPKLKYSVIFIITYHCQHPFEKIDYLQALMALLW